MKTLLILIISFYSIVHASDLEKLPLDVLNIIAQDLRDTDIVNLSILNKTFNAKVGKMRFKMIFHYRNETRMGRAYCKEDFFTHFNGAVGKNVQNIEAGMFLYFHDKKLLNLLPRNLTSLSISDDIEILEKLIPNNFPNLQRLEINTSRELPLKILFLFPKLCYLGSINRSIFLQANQFNLIPSMTEEKGRRLKCLNVNGKKRTDITLDQFITVVNQLPNLEILGFCFNLFFTKEHLNSLNKNPNIKTLVSPFLSIPIQGEDIKCSDLLLKFPNVNSIKSFSCGELSDLETCFNLLKGIEKLDLLWSRRLRGMDSNAFWKSILPNLKKLKSLSVTIQSENLEDLISLSQVPNLEKIRISFEGSFEKICPYLANSKSRVRELILLTHDSCYIRASDPGFQQALLGLTDLKILYFNKFSDRNQARETILDFTNGRVQLISTEADFFEDIP